MQIHCHKFLHLNDRRRCPNWLCSHLSNTEKKINWMNKKSNKAIHSKCIESMCQNHLSQTAVWYKITFAILMYSCLAELLKAITCKHTFHKWFWSSCRKLFQLKKKKKTTRSTDSNGSFIVWVLIYQFLSSIFLK